MRRIISRVKSKLSSNENGRSSDAQSGQEPTQLPADDGPLMQPPTALDVLRHRYQFGVNLVGGFVLEKSTSPGLFEPGEEGKSELDAVSGLVPFKHSMRLFDASFHVAPLFIRLWLFEAFKEGLSWVTDKGSHDSLVEILSDGIASGLNRYERATCWMCYGWDLMLRHRACLFLSDLTLLIDRGNSEEGDGRSSLERSKEGCVAAPAEHSIPFDEVRARMQEADSERKSLKMRDVMAHTAYWSTRGAGWGWGWDDARAFWGMRARGNIEGATTGEVDREGVELGGPSVEGQQVGGDFIGAMEVWVCKRLSEWLAERGMGKTAMSETEEVRMREWESGFRDGVVAFEGVVRRPSWGKGRRFGGDGEESDGGGEGEEGEGRLREVHGGEQANGGNWTE